MEMLRNDANLKQATMVTALHQPWSLSKDKQRSDVPASGVSTGKCSWITNKVLIIFVDRSSLKVSKTQETP